MEPPAIIPLTAQEAVSFSWNHNADRFIPIRCLKSAIALFAGALGLYVVTPVEARAYLNQHIAKDTLAGRVLYRRLIDRNIAVTPVTPKINHPQQDQDSLTPAQSKKEPVASNSKTVSSVTHKTQPGHSEVLPKIANTITVLASKGLNKPRESAQVLRQRIETLLGGIDAEIDQINIPGYLENHDKLRESIKHRFTLYREQLKNYNTPTAKQLQKDLNRLQIMQKTMHTALHSPNATREELPCKGIVNPGLQCSYIAIIQCAFHNQYFIFYIIAADLIGAKALGRESSDENDLDKAKRWCAFYKHHLSEDSEQPTPLPYPEVTGKQTINSIPYSLFNIPVELDAIECTLDDDKDFEALKSPGADIALTVNRLNETKIGGHHWALVKRNDGSFTELNDKTVSPNRFKNLDELKKTYDSQYGIPDNMLFLKCVSNFNMRKN